MNARTPRRRPARAALPMMAVALALFGVSGRAASASTDAAPQARPVSAPTPPSAPPVATRPSAGAVWVGRFGDGLAPWREVRLKPELRPNVFRRVDWDGAAAVEVTSDNAMSLLARPLSVDLAATPVLCWRWRVDAPLKSADMTRRAGDDYAARLYVSLSIPESEQGLALRAQLRLARAIWGPEVPDAAINYVWDNRQPLGTERPNAYTDRTVMVVQRTGAADAGRWVQERRDVRADAARLFGSTATPVQLAVTADTDNTGESARAGFADLHFVAADAPCAQRP
jgi:hypothetical protein